VACAVLHNIYIDNRLPANTTDDMTGDSDDDIDDAGQQTVQQSNGAKTRSRLIQQRFGREI
jgi:hypothetical protein